MEFGEKIADVLVKAERDCYSAEHIIKVIMPVVKDQKLLLRVLETAHKSAISIIGIILKYEYIRKRVDLSSEYDKNIDVFFGKCAYSYGLSNEESALLRRFLLLGEKHRKSGFEFSRVGKIVIMNDDLSIDELTKSELEQFLFVLRKLIKNTKANFMSKI